MKSRQSNSPVFLDSGVDKVTAAALPTEEVDDFKRKYDSERELLTETVQRLRTELDGLKQKYDKEKGLVADMMQRLRTELRLLKEDAATFSSLRAMFATRCEEYAAQVEELSRQLSASNEENRKLNHLLKLAVKQKLDLNKRLESMELKCKAMETRTPVRKNSGELVGISSETSQAKVSR